MSAKCRGGGKGGRGTIKDEIVGEVGEGGGGGRDARQPTVIFAAAPPTAPADSDAGVEIEGRGGGRGADSVVNVTECFAGSDVDVADSTVSLGSTSGNSYGANIVKVAPESVTSVVSGANVTADMGDVAPGGDVVREVAPGGDVVREVAPEGDVVREVAPEGDVVGEVTPGGDVVREVPESDVVEVAPGSADGSSDEIANGGEASGIVAVVAEFF